MAWVYNLRCADDTYCVGSTIEIERRIGQHSAGEGVAYARSRRPVVLVWSFEFDSIRDAFYYARQVQGAGVARDGGR